MTTCSTVQMDSKPASSAVRARSSSPSGKANGPAFANVMPNFMSVPPGAHTTSAGGTAPRVRRSPRAVVGLDFASPGDNVRSHHVIRLATVAVAPRTDPGRLLPLLLPASAPLHRGGGVGVSRLGAPHGRCPAPARP